MSCERDVPMQEYLEKTIGHGSLLYVGIGRHPEHQFINWLIEQGNDITILEAYEPYIHHAKAYLSSRYPDKLMDWNVGDVRDAHKIFKGRMFDVVSWSHGPEHLPIDELPTVFNNLQTITKQIYVGCPNGHFKQDAVGGNQFEVHQSTLYVEDLRKMGFVADEFGPRDYDARRAPHDTIGSILAYLNTK